MSSLYVDVFSGISGDKMVAALLTLQPDIEAYKSYMKTLAMRDEFELEIGSKNVMGIESYTFNVIVKNEHSHHNHHEDKQEHGDHHHAHEHSHGHAHGHGHSHSHGEQVYCKHHHTGVHKHPGASQAHHHRGLTEILGIIDKSGITDRAKEIASGIFKVLGEAEATVHNKPIEEIHFHEVGAVDSIVDIVSVAVLIDLLGIKDVYASDIALGQGFIKVAHGVMPIPVPATCEILKDVPVYQTDIKTELTTPTGASVIKYLTKSFGKMPRLNIHKVGYGAGTRDLEIPNVLRVFLCEPFASGKKKDLIVSLQTNLDDATPENIAFLTETLMNKKALDVYITPIVMKKGRQAQLLTVFCKEESVELLEKEIFLNSTTFGIRKNYFDRTILDRKFETIDYQGLPVTIKYGYLNDSLIHQTIEYESLKNVCETLDISYTEAEKKIRELINSNTE